MATHIDLEWADGTYRFRLPLPQINELQRKTGKGIGLLFQSVLKGRYNLPDGTGSFGNPIEAEFHSNEIIETIRQGLIGGRKAWLDGTEKALDDPAIAALMLTYVYPERPLAECWSIAASILLACIEGYEEPDKKKEQPARVAKKKKPATTTETDGSIMPAPLAT